MITFVNPSCLLLGQQVQLNFVTILKALCLVTITIITVCGNGLVVLAVATYKRLRTVNCQLLASLAVADLSLGIIVLPFSTVTELYQTWIFGSALCHVWLSADILLCTASIYSLTLISADRYMALSRPLFYRSRITQSRTKLMILGFWTVALSICLPTIIPFEYLLATDEIPMNITFFHSNFTTVSNTSLQGCKCTPLNNSSGYIIFSSVGSFFVPTIWIIVSYSKIIAIARRALKCNEINLSEFRKTRPKISHARRKSSDKSCVIKLMQHVPTNVCAKHVDIDLLHRIEAKRSKPNVDDNVIRVHRGRSQSQVVGIELDTPGEIGGRWYRSAANQSLECLIRQQQIAAIDIFSSEGFATNDRNDLPNEIDDRAYIQRLSRATIAASTSQPLKQHRHSNFLEKIYQQTAAEHQGLIKELRILKGIGIMTGCYIFCWVGFAISYLLQAFPFCRGEHHCIPDWLFSLVFWLGYSNSALNPFIYAICHKDFRKAFRRMTQRNRRRIDYSWSTLGNRSTNM